MTEAPVVTVEQGQLQGRVVSSPSGKAFYSFQGIPYAKPPLGSLRFKAPQPPEPWEGIRDATSEGNISAQVDPIFAKSYVGDENCLFLNVYTPNIDGSFLPVMIYIHGGGFRWGSGSSNLYGGDYLVEKDVVVVTLNYRCGPLGFLCLNTPEVPGNAGLKDIVQAIRWVKDNIQNFGGNPGNLTVFGESAGGVAVSVLTASPLTKHLINKGIIQSGTALSRWIFQKDPLYSAGVLAKSLGCEAGDVDEILEFLTATPTKDLVEAYENTKPSELFTEKCETLFGIVVEKEFPGVEAVLTEAFIDILTSGRIAEVPVMIGSTTLEFALEHTSGDVQNFIPSELNIEPNTDVSTAIAEEIKKLYFKGDHTEEDSKEEYYQLMSDKLFNIDTHRYVKYLVQVTNKPIYFYKFDYVGELNFAHKAIFNIGPKYAMHMDDLGYLFKNDFQRDVEPTPQDIKMRERMVRLWTNFAKTGNPTPDENHYLTTKWLPVTKDKLYYLNLGTELTLGTNPDNEKMEFWDELYNKHFKIWDHPKTNTIEAPRKEPEVVSYIETVVITTQVVENNESISESIQTFVEPIKLISEPIEPAAEPIEPVVEPIEPVVVPSEPIAVPSEPAPLPIKEEVRVISEVLDSHVNGNGGDKHSKPRTSNEIKMVQHSNGGPRDVIRASDPPEDDLPKNIGVNKFVNFFESLGGKK